MDPWEEALDLDDSDIPSLLRPCKRQQTHSQSQSRIQPSSSQSSLLSPFDSPRSNPELPSQPFPTAPSHPADSQPRCYTQSPVPPPAPSFSSLIPGPAGIVQAAIHQVIRDSGDSKRVKEVQMSTQEYMTRVEQNEDEDFKNSSWTKALESLSRGGLTRTESLSDIKNHRSGDKIDTIVAIIKSCTPNGLGDILVVLKDPTDTVAATVHRKVLAEGAYAGDMVVGSILVLKKVSVFCPSHKSYYLNISLSNVVEVFSRSSGNQSYLLSTAKNRVPVHSNPMAVWSSKHLKMPEQNSRTVLTGENLTEVQQECSWFKSSSIEVPVGAEDLAVASQTFGIKDGVQYASLRDRFLRQDNNISSEPIQVDLVDSNLKICSDKNKQPTGEACSDFIRTQTAEGISDMDDAGLCPSSGAWEQRPNMKNCFQSQGKTQEDVTTENVNQVEEQAASYKVPVENEDGSVISQTNGFKNTERPPNVMTQQWTDEQLDILDMDEDF